MLAPSLPAAFGASPSGVAAPEAFQQGEPEPAGADAGIGPANFITAPESAPQPEDESLAAEFSAIAEPSGVSDGQVAFESQPTEPQAAGIVSR
jgi:hypothetical protein